MAKQSTKSNQKDQKKQNTIIVCIAAVVLIIAIIVTVVVINKNSLNNGSFFVSDGSKLVIPLESGDRLSSDEDEPAPQKTYFVYYYKDNDITDLKIYQEYTNDSVAKEAYTYYKNNLSPYLKDISLDGKHVIITQLPEEYEGITAEDVRATIKYNEENGNLIEDTDDGTDEGTEEDTEEE